MSAYPAKVLSEVSIAPSLAGVYRVSTNLTSGAVELDLRQDLWAPAKFAIVARTVTKPPAGVHQTGMTSPVHPVLLDLTPATLVEASTSISRALEANMRDARAHEAAALTLAAFAIRESGGRFYDARWAMNRMTAHLAMASAAREDNEPGIDGRLAEAVLLTLTNHQTRALDALDRLENDQRSSAVATWTRALRLRITQDWRTIHAPASASVLEKREYFRARRATVGMTAQVELEKLGVSPSADWFRILEASFTGVEDGWLITDALAGERDEYKEVFQRIHGRAIGSDPTADLNARATRCIGDAGPDVLPWGAWAEFAQRHLALFVDKSDRFYRHMLGSEGRADAGKQRLKRELGGLAMFPVATIFWTKGPKGGEADLAFIREAIDAALRAPERVTPAAWEFLERGAHYEPVRYTVPSPGGWFVRPSPRTAYDVVARLRDAGHILKLDELDALRLEAPYDYALANEYLRIKFAGKAPYGEIRRVYGSRLDYDVRALSIARQVAPDDAEQLSLLRTSCAVSAAKCIDLGWTLKNADRADEAAVSYERAFADPSLDVVMMANSSGWLIDYYYRHGRVGSALELAERSADTGSAQGLVTAAHLYERLGRFEDALEAYECEADRYENPAELLGFYYRAINVRKQFQYEAVWKSTLAPVFPAGLAAAPTDSARPAGGVIVTKDNQTARQAGLQAGDIIVGLEGWRVANLQQYRAVNAFFEPEQTQMTLTVWRGHLFPVTVVAPDRFIGIEFRSYPIEGWSEK